MFKALIVVPAAVIFALGIGAAYATDGPHGKDPCGHGNSNKPCKPDPQPDKGKDCEAHGNNGGKNEDHCDKGTTPTTPTTTTPTTTTPTTTTPTTTTPTVPTPTTPNTTVPTTTGSTPPATPPGTNTNPSTTTAGPVTTPPTNPGVVTKPPVVVKTKPDKPKVNKPQKQLEKATPPKKATPETLPYTGTKLTVGLTAGILLMLFGAGMVWGLPRLERKL